MVYRQISEAKAKVFRQSLADHGRTTPLEAGWYLDISVDGTEYAVKLFIDTCRRVFAPYAVGTVPGKGEKRCIVVEDNMVIAALLELLIKRETR